MARPSRRLSDRPSICAPTELVEQAEAAKRGARRLPRPVETSDVASAAKASWDRGLGRAVAVDALVRGFAREVSQCINGGKPHALDRSFDVRHHALGPPAAVPRRLAPKPQSLVFATREVTPSWKTAF